MSAADNRFGSDSKKLKFYTAGQIVPSGKNGGFETKTIANTDPLYMPNEAPKERVSLYDQIKANKTREEDELAERRKNMYGVRPMDDEEYKDYQLMSISKRKREEEDQVRLNRERKEFQQMQHDALLEEAEEQTKIDNLSFGSKSIEKKQDEKAFSTLGIKIKVKPKKTEKKKKAPTPSPINLLSYGEEDLCVYIKHEKGINKLTFAQ